MVTTLTCLCVCVPNVTTCVPCEWCTQSCAIVALHVCTVCPQGHRPGRGTLGWGRLPLHWADLRIPSQPKPYRPVISQVAGDAFSRGLHRPPRCDFRLLRVGRRKHFRFPINAPHIRLKQWAWKESISLHAGQRPAPTEMWEE